MPAEQEQLFEGEHHRLPGDDAAQHRAGGRLAPTRRRSLARSSPCDRSRRAAPPPRVGPAMRCAPIGPPLACVIARDERSRRPPARASRRSGASSELRPVASASLWRGMLAERHGGERNEEAGEARRPGCSEHVDDVAGRGVQRVVAHHVGADANSRTPKADRSGAARPGCRAARRWASPPSSPAMRGISARPDCIAVKPSSSCMNTGRRKVIDISIANMTAPTSVPEVKTVSLKSAQVHRRHRRGQLADDERRDARTRRRRPAP